MNIIFPLCGHYNMFNPSLCLDTQIVSHFFASAQHIIILKSRITGLKITVVPLLSTGDKWMVETRYSTEPHIYCFFLYKHTYDKVSFKN